MQVPLLINLVSLSGWFLNCDVWAENNLLFAWWVVHALVYMTS